MAAHRRIFNLVFDPATCLTLLGAALSLASMAFAARGAFEAMALCAIWAGICDFLDGPLARALPSRDPGRPAFGAHLDSLVDMVCFGVAPVAVAWLIGNRTALDAVLSLCYLVCAAQRLAFFGVQEDNGGGGARRHFTGLPVTFASLFFALAYPLSRLADGRIFPWALRAVMASLALLFVGNFRMPKPRGVFYPIFILIALGLSAFWIVGLLG